MKAVVAAFNQEKALVGAFSVITNLRMELFEALFLTVSVTASWRKVIWQFFWKVSVHSSCCVGLNCVM